MNERSFRFLHAADVHLDSPLTGLDRYESAPVDAARGATRRAFEHLVQAAIDEDVAFVLLAGDLYDGDWKDYGTGLFFVEQMAKLRDAGIDVFIVAGNHDAASQLTKTLRPPENVHFFSTKSPETRLIDSVAVAIHGQGFSSRHEKEDLAASFPVAVPDRFNIGLLHTSLDGRVGHEPYAPTSFKILAQKEYQYWALGHVHKREVVSKDPWIVFPGNIQGRHAREIGPKGFALVTVENGFVANVEECSADVLRWTACQVNIDGSVSTNEMLDRVRDAFAIEVSRADGRTLAVRVEVTGAAACHSEIADDPERWVQEIRALAADVSTEGVWVEKVRFLTSQPTDLDALATRDDALGSLVRTLAVATSSPEETKALRDALAELRTSLPQEILAGDDSADPQDSVFIERLVAEARDLLLARLMRAGGTS